MTTSKMIIPALMTVFLAGGAVVATKASAAPHEDHGGQHEMQNHDGQDGGKGMGGCPMMRGHGGGHGKMNLTPEQRQKMNVIMEEAHTRLTPLRDQIYVKHQEMKALQNATNPDVKAVSQKATEITALREKMRAERKALGDRIDKELGLEPGTHNFDGYGHKGARGGHGY